MSALIGQIVAFIIAGLAILGLVPHQQTNIECMPGYVANDSGHCVRGTPVLYYSPSRSEPLTATFQALNGGVETLGIDFGDDSSIVKAGKCNSLPNTFPCSIVWDGTTHTYNSPGTYTVRLVDYSTGQQLTSLNITLTSTNSTVSSISVPGMSKYTNADFGFSFWYPSGWTVQVAKGYEPNIVRSLILINASGNKVMSVDEVNSSIATGIKNVDCGVGYHEGYYFDQNKSIWMKWITGLDVSLGIPVKHKSPADISHNTAGGLHILQWTCDGSNMHETVPLSPVSFVDVMQYSTSGVNVAPLANTIVATDSSAGTPVAAAEQIKVIQAEKDAYAGQ